MLNEIRDVRQIEKEGFRRWFTDRDMDLIVWYSREEITGFQLCYDKQKTEKALTWKTVGGYSHNRIDTGENPARNKMSPVLVADGLFDTNRISRIFTEKAEKLDKPLADFILGKLSRYI